MHIAAASFLYNWQTLIGAALGPFLAVIVSLLFQSWRERKEAIRMVEVSITRSINDLYSTRKKLEDFSRRLRVLASDARAITDDRTYFL
jgi:hypothetical protein